MKLFDDFHRTYLERANHAEEKFSFLNRSAQPAAEKVRKQLQQWFERYPMCEQEVLRTRFRSEFESAFWELVLHVILRKHGAVVEVHPVISQESETKPDFFARLPDSREAVVEAAVCHDISNKDRAAEAMLKSLFDEIEKTECRDFYLDLRRVRYSSGRQPSGKRIRAFLKRELRGLYPDQIADDMQRDGPDAAPAFVFRDGDFKLEVSVIPKSPRFREGNRKRWVVVPPTRTRWGGSDSALRTSTLSKATRYGELSHPYVVAVNALSRWGTDQEDVLMALFGTVEYERTVRTGRRNPACDCEAVWVSSGGPQNTGVSAVLVTKVTSWNMATARLLLYHNPFAARPCLDLPWRVDQYVPRGDEYQFAAGETSGAILGLDVNWPGELFP